MTAATVSADPRITDARDVFRDYGPSVWPEDRYSRQLIGRAWAYLAEVITGYGVLMADEEDPDGIEAAADEAGEAAKALRRVLGERREWERKQEEAASIERAREWMSL